MEPLWLVITGAAGLLIGGFAVNLAWQRKMKNRKIFASTDNSASTQLQLQAYERLVVLVDRIALPNLISRVGQADISAREMQMILTRNIREEFEYNISQQIFVTPDAWNSVKNLKEQNLLIINQLANILPPNASGLDLNKQLLQYLMNDRKGTLHEVVSEVLSYEAKKLI
ncbi:MAG TPA: hypothetical protein VF145_03385 [Chitinophagaceae bacterium]